MVPSSGGHGRKVGVCTSIRNSPDVVVVGHDTTLVFIGFQNSESV